MSDVDYDLDALVVEVEDADPWRFKWGGKTFEMPLQMAMPLEDQLALETATTMESLRIIMGDQFDDLMTTPGPNGRPLSTARAKTLFEEWNRFQGLEPGESRASSRSSVNTARRSRRTSRSAR